MTNDNANGTKGDELVPAAHPQQPSTRADEPMVADPDGEARELRERIAAMREEAKTADAKRRTEIGWWLLGATKHLGRLAGVRTAQRLGEHQVVMTKDDGEGVASLCSCGALIPGEIRVDMTVEEFLSTDGHLAMAADDALVSPLTLGKRLKACSTDSERVTVLRQWIAEIEQAMARTRPRDRQSMSLWVWAAQQHLERLTKDGSA